MTQKDENRTRSGQKTGNAGQGNSEGYPVYPANEDVYSKFTEESEIDPEDISTTKPPNGDDNAAITGERDFNGSEMGDDLDVPGSELDDDQENIGSEDEENNYYSVGGDAHSDLDETETE